MVVFFPVVWLITRRHPALAALVIRRRARWLGVLGVFGVALFCACSLLYLHCAAFWDFFECRDASVAALLRRGGSTYLNLADPERYCSPYGPAFYLLLAGAQTVFGATVFATKLPSVLAGFVTLGLFWRIARRQYGSATAAWALTGLLAAFLLALRQLPFWAKTDPLVLCLVTVGLLAAYRRGWGWCVLLGSCAGMAIDLKPHALAYFLPALVIARQSGWRGRQYALWMGVTAVVAMGPFLVWHGRISLENYLSFLVLTAREGTGVREILGFCRWTLFLGGFVWVFNRLVVPPRPLTAEECGLRRAYHAALGLAILLVAWPASSIGAGQPHLLPLIPSILLAAGDRYSNTLRVRWRARPAAPWIALACSTLLACVCVAVQTTVQMVCFHLERHAPARACLADARALLTGHPDLTLLDGSGDGSDLLTGYTRHALVLAGQPIGLDAAAVLDYQRGGERPPDLDALLSKLQTLAPGREVAWLLPRGQVPFWLFNLYDDRMQVYSAQFRREFFRRFERREQTRFYDVYRVRRTPARELRPLSDEPTAEMTRNPGSIPGFNP